MGLLVALRSNNSKTMRTSLTPSGSNLLLKLRGKSFLAGRSQMKKNLERRSRKKRNSIRPITATVEEEPTMPKRKMNGSTTWFANRERLKSKSGRATIP
jgi:hypothetical protein